jgi:hypothetical protein
MANPVELHASQSADGGHSVHVIDDTMWRSWRQKGRARDLRKKATLVKRISVAIVISIAMLWLYEAVLK